MGRCPRSLKSASCKAALAIWPDRRTSLAGMPCCARQSGGVSGSAVGAGPAGLRAAPRRIELRSPANTCWRAQSVRPSVFNQRSKSRPCRRSHRPAAVCSSGPRWRRNPSPCLGSPWRRDPRIRLLEFTRACEIQIAAHRRIAEAGRRSLELANERHARAKISPRRARRPEAHLAAIGDKHFIDIRSR